jgi:hypothetical protein
MKRSEETPASKKRIMTNVLLVLQNFMHMLCFMLHDVIYCSTIRLTTNETTYKQRAYYLFVVFIKTPSFSLLNYFLFVPIIKLFLFL